MLRVWVNQTTRSSGPAVTTLKFLAAWMISPWSRLGSSSFSAVATSLNVIVTCASDAAPGRDRTRRSGSPTMRPMLPS